MDICPIELYSTLLMMVFKLNYLLRDKQLVSEIFFINAEQQSTFDLLVSDIINKVRIGAKFEEIKREQVPCCDIKLEVADGFMGLICNYTPYAVACQAIEDWIPKWCSCFEKLDSSACYIPDSTSTIRISYNLSFFDRLEMWKAKLQGE